MREAIGGTYQFGFMITFIAIFIAFLAFSINYAQAFQVKNNVITIVEQYEGDTDAAKDAIEEYIDSIGYYPWGGNVADPVDSMVDCYEVAKPGLGTYQLCDVTAIIDFSIPVFGASFEFDVTGQTQLILVKD